MDIAIVTGASSSLGLAISRRLMQMGFRVYGLGGDYANCPINNVNFKPFNCDLSDPVAVEEAAKKILEKEKGILVLVNNAKYFGRNDYLEMDTHEMEQILRINLLCPLVLAKTLANSLMTLQGFLIQLGSPHAETSRGGPVGAAASGGLKWMGDVLFHDLRHQGVKVCHLSPEPNRGRDPRSIARPGARTEATIDPEAVAQAIEQILQSPFGNIVTEMVIRPLRVKEPEHDPVIRLPRPHPMPVPYTVPREMIEAEDQLEDEEIEKNLNKQRERRRAGKKPARQNAEPDQDNEKQSERPAAQRADKPADKRDERSREKRPERPADKRDERADDKRREKRPDKPDHKRADRPSRKPSDPHGGKPSGERQPEKPAPERQAPQQPASEPSAKNESHQQPNQNQNRRRRSRRKPRPPMSQVGFLDKKDSQTSPQSAKPAEQPAARREEAPAPSPREDPPVKKTAKKAVKKAAKKAVRKTAVKKTAARKAAKKAVPRKAARKKAPNESASEADTGKSG